jgi:ribosomal protein L25 (general stress protein Ctc)
VNGVPSSAAVVKLQGNDRESVTRGALEILRKAGQIDRFEL